MITNEQFQEWKAHPVTKEIFIELNKVKTELIEQLVIGNTIGMDAQSTHGLTNRVVGQIDGLNQLINISFNDTDLTSVNINPVSGY